MRLYKASRTLSMYQKQCHQQKDWSLIIQGGIPESATNASQLIVTPGCIGTAREYLLFSQAVAFPTNVLERGYHSCNVHALSWSNNGVPATVRVVNLAEVISIAPKTARRLPATLSSYLNLDTCTWHSSGLHHWSKTVSKNGNVEPLLTTKLPVLRQNANDNPWA